MANRLCGMPVAAKVNAFEREVGRDEQFASRRYPQHGAVVADASDQILSGVLRATRALSGIRHAANLCDERFFGKRHGLPIYRLLRQEQQVPPPRVLIRFGSRLRPGKQEILRYASKTAPLRMTPHKDFSLPRSGRDD